MNNINTKILTVDDQSEDLEILNHILEKENYQTISAKNGREALELIETQKDIDVIVLDRMMPVMDGISFLRRLRDYPEFANIPVIMQTAADSEEQISEGVDAGVYWYITKPFSAKILTKIVKSALRMQKRNKKMAEITDFYVQRRKKLKAGMEKLKRCEFEFQTLDEAKDVANAISVCFPKPRDVVGPCLELLVNAVEHGNLGISFEEKSNLILDGMWKDEIDYRTKLKENRDKYVRVTVNKEKEFMNIYIKDEGKGFDPIPFLTLEANRAHKINGRGIYIAGLEFDKIEYLGNGNEVVCWKYL